MAKMIIDLRTDYSDKFVLDAKDAFALADIMSRAKLARHEYSPIDHYVLRKEELNLYMTQVNEKYIVTEKIKEPEDDNQI